MHTRLHALPVSLRIPGTGSQPHTHNGRKELLPALHTFCFQQRVQEGGLRWLNPTAPVCPHYPPSSFLTPHAHTRTQHTHPETATVKQKPAAREPFEINGYMDALACCSTHGPTCRNVCSRGVPVTISAAALFILAAIYRYKWSVSL